MNGLAGKTAIVAGGASGIGKATAHRLAQEGVSVVVADISEPGAIAVADAISAAGGSAVGTSADISDETQVNAMVELAVSRFDQLNLLFNVAADIAFGIAHDNDILGTSLDTFDQTLAVTLRGYILACRAALPHMVASGGGSIVNTSSLAASRAMANGKRYSYSIAKSGLGPLSQHIAVRHGGDGVRCNTVALGMFLSEAALATHTPEELAALPGAGLVPNPGRPEGVASVVAFLLSDDARYITGQTINVDGGASAKL